MKRFVKLPLSLAVMSVLATSAFANEQAVEPTVVLEGDTIVIDRQGTKVKTNVVTEEEKDESTATDLRGLLKEEPSIEFGGGNGTSQYWSIRGMGQNSIDVKVDNAYSDTQILYHQGRFMLDPALVKIVSVQKGAGAASAGIGATNGAIIAKTVDAKDLLAGSDKDYGVQVNAGYSSSNNAPNYGIKAYGQTDNFDLILAANFANEDDYHAGEDYINPYNNTNEVPYSGLDKRSYLAKAGVNLGKHRFVASHLHEEQSGVRAVREEFTVFTNNLDTDRQAPRYRETTLDNTNLEWTAKDLGLVSEATANVYLMKNERYSEDDAKCGYCGNIAGETTTAINTHGANLNLDWDAQGLATVKTGVNYRHQEVEPDRFLKPNLSNPEKTDIGGYIEAIGEIGDVTATAGVRYDYFEFKAMDGKTVSGGAMNPSFGLIWQATPGLSLNANHNYATRSPRLYDALMSHGNRGIVSIADNTKAETARNTEVGFNYNYDFGEKGKLALDGSYFWQKIEDAVVNPQNRHDTQGVREIVNAGYITNEGYEVGATYRLGGLTAKVAVSESNPEFHQVIAGTDVNPDFAFNQGRVVTSSLAYRFAKPNLEIGVRNRDVAKAEGAVVVGSTALPIRPSYNVTDVFANWKPYGDDRMNVNVGVNNVTDEFYYSHAQRANGGLPATGRDYRVGVNFKF